MTYKHKFEELYAEIVSFDLSLERIAENVSHLSMEHIQSLAKDLRAKARQIESHD